MFYPELKGVALKAQNDMIMDLKEKSTSELGLTGKELIVRPLKALDLKLSTNIWHFTPSTSNSWNTVINAQTIDDNKFIGINGIFNGESASEVTQIKITRKGSDARIWNVTPIINYQNKIGYCDDPVTLDQNTSLTMQFYVRTASTINLLGFIGAVAETRGLTINP